MFFKQTKRSKNKPKYLLANANKHYYNIAGGSLQDRNCLKESINIDTIL